MKTIFLFFLVAPLLANADYYSDVVRCTNKFLQKSDDLETQVMEFAFGDSLKFLADVELKETIQQKFTQLMNQRKDFEITVDSSYKGNRGIDCDDGRHPYSGTVHQVENKIECEGWSKVVAAEEGSDQRAQLHKEGLFQNFCRKLSREKAAELRMPLQQEDHNTNFERPWCFVKSGESTTDQMLRPANCPVALCASECDSWDSEHLVRRGVSPDGLGTGNIILNIATIHTVRGFKYPFEKFEWPRLRETSPAAFNKIYKLSDPQMRNLIEMSLDKKPKTFIPSKGEYIEKQKLLETLRGSVRNL
eukprot:Filipodium_phascolosomae@DN2373_c0_g1_i2.p1